MTIRCLARTADEGIIVKPSSKEKLALHAHVDADFGGLHGQEPQDDPNSAGSRCGCIICFNDIPLIWKSQSIKEICLSTLHSECVGLSHCCRALIPVQEMILDVQSFHGLISPNGLKISNGSKILNESKILSIGTKS